jgi:hypothetical protein
MVLCHGLARPEGQLIDPRVQRLDRGYRGPSEIFADRRVMQRGNHAVSVFVAKRLDEKAVRARHRARILTRRQHRRQCFVFNSRFWRASA